jgi:hypothetical protein
MKVSTGLFTLMLASQVLPWAIQPVQAQTVDAKAAQREDDSDGRQLKTYYQIYYRQASLYAYKIPAYSVEEVTEKNQTLADGNQLKNRQSSVRHRDQNGRIRISFKSYSGNDRIFIGDPNAKVAYLIRPNRKDILRFSGEPPATRIDAEFLYRTGAPEWNKQVMTSLGVKEFAGVKAAGMLTETYFPAGARGNEKEMVETTENWRSRELTETVYSRNFSPRDGERIVRLENLKLGDVPESLYAVPADYAIRDVVLDTAQVQR